MSGTDLLRPGAKLSRRLLKDAISGSRLRLRSGRDMRISQAGVEAIAGVGGRRPNRPVHFMACVLSHTSDRRMHFTEVYKPEPGYDAYVEWEPGRKSEDIGAAYIMPQTAPLPPAGDVVRLHEITLADGDAKECWLYAPGSPEFGALITGNDYGAWPRAYSWEPSRAAGPYEQILPGAPGWEELGAAHNFVEMAPGFGDTVGPYGGQMSDAEIEVEILAIPTGQPVRMWLSSDQFGQPWPRFSAPNALKVTCKTPPAPGAATSGGAAILSRDLVPCGGCG